MEQRRIQGGWSKYKLFLQQKTLSKDPSFDQLEYKGVISSADSAPSDTCIRFLLNNFLLNGMFSLTQTIGFIQFMVFVIIRLIVIGSLAGRLFIDDLSYLNCTLASNLSSTENSSITTLSPQNETSTIWFYDVQSSEVKKDCLSVVYKGSTSPFTFWIFTLLTAVLPWLALMPWTPYEPGQDHIHCPVTSCRWPCLTLAMLCFVRASLRLVLDLACFIGVIVAYRMYIPECVTCHDEKVNCHVKEYNEQTCFLWILTIVNLISMGLNVFELVHICVHKENYEEEVKHTFVFDKIHRHGRNSQTAVAIELNDTKEEPRGDSATTVLFSESVSHR